MRTLLGEELYDAVRPKYKNDLMRAFESRVKRVFRGDMEDDHVMDFLGVEDNEEAGIEDNELLVKG